MTFLEYIERNLPEGVAMKVTKHERRKLPEIIDNHLKDMAAEVKSSSTATKEKSE